MITDAQMRTVEGCCRLVLQKIASARIADSTVRSVVDNPKSYSSLYIRDAERAGRFADAALTTALDELRDEVTAVVVPAKLEAYYGKDGYAGKHGET
jgi:hypothetical protein